MKRVCPQCSEKSIQLKMLSFGNRMQCSNCYSEFKYTAVGSFILSILASFIPIVVIIIGLETKSWILACLFLFAVPLVGELTFAKYCKLKPVGRKALKDRIHQKIVNKIRNENESKKD